MKVFPLLAALVFLSVPALAPAQQKAPAHQPGVAAPPSAASEQNAGPPSLEKPDPAKDAAVRQLMEITETNKLGDNIAAAISNQVRQVMGRAIKPDQLPMFMEQFSQKLNAAAPPSTVTDAIVPIYSRHFTMEQIQGLIKFYQSPLGQSVVKAMPQITQESEATGIQLDQKAAIAVLRSMQDQYPELKQMLPPEGGVQGGVGAPPPPGQAPGAANPGAAPAPRNAPAPPKP